MIRRASHSLTLLEFESLSAKEGVRHFISTRLGGVSPPPFDSLNLGFRMNDDPACVLGNRERLAEAVGFPLDHLTVTKQVHGDRVRIIGTEQRGMGARDYEGGMSETDALVTDVLDICIMVLVADCVPILLYDAKRGVIGAVHSGWKGTAAKIGLKAVRTMCERYGCRASDIIAGIGPSIGPCCYEVGCEIASTVESAAGMTSREKIAGKSHLDLWEANRRVLIESGIPDASIETARICTRCRADLFYSERHHPGTGRFAAGILLSR